VAKDEGSRVLINPTALFGGCEIGRNEKFLLTLHYKKKPPGIVPGGHNFVY
jgi:hypothetical protein